MPFRRPLAVLVVVAGFVAVAGLVRLKPDATDGQNPPQPTFRTEANYVRVDVYPTIKGAPVEDLKREDFEVFEDKAPQPIDTFQYIHIRAAGPQDTRREPNTIAESRAMMEDPEARLFVIFLDFYHVEVDASHRIRKPLIDMLDRMIGEKDLVAVMTPEMSARDLTFARRTTTIEGFLTRYWPWGERDQLNSKDPQEDRYRECYPGFGPTAQCKDDDRGVATEMIARRREKRTIDTLQDLVRHLRGLREERKAIVTISDGWLLYRPNPALARQLFCQPPGPPQMGIDPRTGKITTGADPQSATGGSMYQCDRDRQMLSQIDDESEFRDILDAANRSNSTFYPVDPRGLAVFDTPINAISDAGHPATPIPLTVDAGMLRTRIGSLRTLAEATDGIAIVDTNNLSTGMQRIVTDLSSYYLLGYYSNGKLDGKFHSITVRVKRPGVDVRARRGYLAMTAAEAAAAKAAAAAPVADPGAAAETHAREAALAPLASLARDQPVRLHVVAGWRPIDRAVFWVVGETAHLDDWMAGGQADVIVNGPGGTSIASGRATIEPGAKSFRVAIQAPEPVKPGEYEVQVRSRSAGGGPPSNDSVKITVPAAPQPSGALFLRRGPTTGNKEAPAADLRFRRSDRLKVEVPTAAAGPVSAQLLDRNGKATPVPVTAASRTDADGTAWQTAEVALTPLAPGDYLVEIRAGGAGESGGAAGGAGGQRVMLAAFRIVQ